MCVGAGEVKIMTVSEKTREKIWSKKRDEGGGWHPVEPFISRRRVQCRLRRMVTLLCKQLFYRLLISSKV